MNKISKTFNNFADGLVIYSQRYGKISWVIFLIIFACIMTITF
ncbi:MAG: glycoside hydrolase family 10 protein, partial [Microcystis aeruginosa]